MLHPAYNGGHPAVVSARPSESNLKDGLPLEMISETSTDDEFEDAEDGDDTVQDVTVGDDDDDDDDTTTAEDSSDDELKPPKHPITAMQGPFEESMWDSERREANVMAQRRQSLKLNAKARHQRLLDNRGYNESYNARWRRNPRAKYHPITKLVAQLVFGVHLLYAQLAKSNEEVVNILQRHVDEVDSFIQRAGEDFDVALADIRERINYLKLPLEHVNIFDIMLDDKNFRTQILQGNDKIEQVVTRTAELMNDAMVDIGKGLEATKDMSDYLDDIEDTWPDDENGSIQVYETMRSNASGWLECFRDLQLKGSSLGVALVQLGSILNEMTKRAGVASRRSVPASRPGSAQSQNTIRNVRFQHPTPSSRYARSMAKPLPSDPDLVAAAVQATLPKRAATPIPERHENPRYQTRTPVNPPSPIHESPVVPLTRDSLHLTAHHRDYQPLDTDPDSPTDSWGQDEKEEMTALPVMQPRPTETVTQPVEKVGLIRRTSSRLRRKTQDVAERLMSPPTQGGQPSPPDSTYSSDSKASWRRPARPGSRPSTAQASYGRSTTPMGTATVRPSTKASNYTAPPSRAGLPRGKFSLFPPSATPSLRSAAIASDTSLPLRTRPSLPLRSQSALSRPGTSMSQRPGSPLAERPGSPYSIRPGSPLAERPGSPYSIRPGSPLNERPGSPFSVRPGSPFSQRPGSPLSIRPGSPFSQRPGTSMSQRPGTSMSQRPGTSMSQRPGTSMSQRPGTSMSQRPGTSQSQRPGTSQSQRPGTANRSRPGTAAGREAVESRPGTAMSQRPGTAMSGSRPGTGFGSRPGTAFGRSSRPGTAFGSRPGTAFGSRPGTAFSMRPGTALAGAGNKIRRSSGIRAVKNFFQRRKGVGMKPGRLWRGKLDAVREIT